MDHVCLRDAGEHADALQPAYQLVGNFLLSKHGKACWS